MVSSFYQDVSSMPQIPDQEMNSTMQQLSMLHIGEFDTVAALKELYIYVNKYRVQLFENLEEENYCRKLQLAQRLANVACVMEGEETSACWCSHRAPEKKRKKFLDVWLVEEKSLSDLW